MSDPLKTLTHPTTGQTFKMGRRRPIARRLGLKLGNYLKLSYANAPASVDYYPKAAACLGQIMMNDQLGCCTSAAALHIEGLFRGNAGNPVTFTNEQVVAFYSATTGYKPGDAASDQGGDEPTVLDYWREHGLDGKGNNRIIGHASVNAADPREVKAAMYLFENLYFGVSMPDAWVNPMPEDSGFVWTKSGAPNDDNGHAFAGYGYNANGVRISTWGMMGLMTWDAVAAYATHAGGGELHTVISQDALVKATQKTPTGFDWSQLIADFDSLGANVKSASTASVSTK